MSRYSRHNPDEPISHDWIGAGSVRTGGGELASSPCSGDDGQTMEDHLNFVSGCMAGYASIHLKSSDNMNTEKPMLPTEILYRKIGFAPGDKVKLSPDSEFVYEVAGVKRFAHGYMVGIYDEPPSRHVDYWDPGNLHRVNDRPNQ